jgi:hypothetical protein
VSLGLVKHTDSQEAISKPGFSKRQKMTWPKAGTRENAAFDPTDLVSVVRVILHYKAICRMNAPTELVSVEQVILHYMRIVANHGLHPDKLGEGRNAHSGSV